MKPKDCPNTPFMDCDGMCDWCSKYKRKHQCPQCSGSDCNGDCENHSHPAKEGKCPKCLYGNLVVLFGTIRYCDSCEYKE